MCFSTKDGKEFIREVGEGVADVLKDCKENQTKEINCNKDTGAKRTLNRRSRGHIVAVTAGGIIRMFTPIYK